MRPNVGLERLAFGQSARRQGWASSVYFKHHDVRYSLPDEWWEEAGMRDAKLIGHSYLGGQSLWPELEVCQIAISDIQPLVRLGSYGVFNDNAEFGTAHNRVVQILRGIREQAPIPPVEVSRLPAGEFPTFKLIHGAHRLYCSIAVGFTHVPAVEVVDFFGIEE